MSTNDTEYTDGGGVDGSNDEDRSARDPGDRSGGIDDRADLAARAELLEAENRRLRREYARARQTRYRRTAFGLAGLGLLAVAAGALFPDGREVLVALGATGLFGAALTYYLSPGRFVAADVGERVYAAAASNEAAIADELGLRDDRRYLPADDGARLFVPQRASGELPDADEGPIVVDDDRRGLLLEATGSALFREFERTIAGDLASAPEPLSIQLADGLVDALELVGAAEPDVDAENRRLTVAIADSAFGDVDRFDHPAASFLATGVAIGLDRPVDLSVARGDDRADWLVTCRWEGDEE